MLPTNVFTAPSNTPRFGAAVPPGTFTAPSNTPRFGEALPGWEQGGIDDPTSYFVPLDTGGPIPPAEQAGVIPNGTPVGAVSQAAGAGMAAGGLMGAFMGAAMGVAFWRLASKGYVPAWAGYSISVMQWVGAAANLGIGGYGVAKAAGMAGLGRYGDYVQLPYSGYGDYVQLPYSGYGDYVQLPYA
jgi:hypothetical protein